MFGSNHKLEDDIYPIMYNHITRLVIYLFIYFYFILEEHISLNWLTYHKGNFGRRINSSMYEEAGGPNEPVSFFCAFRKTKTTIS